MCKIIAISNQKGGVGKTTTSINLAASLAIFEQRVLLIDADPQGNTTSSFSIEVTENTFQTIDLFNCSNENNNLPSETSTPYLHVIPTTIGLLNLEIVGKNYHGSNQELKNSLNDFKENYDYIIIDCCPSLNFITTSFLMYSDSVLIPIQCEYYAFNGLLNLFNVIKTIRANYNSNLDIEGILITMYDKRLNFSKSIVSEIQKYFSLMVFSTIIERNVKLGEAQSHGKTITEYDISCRGAENYLALATEVIENNKATLMKKVNLGKNLNQILEECEKKTDLMTIFDKLPINRSHKEISIYYSQSSEKLIGLTKLDINSIFGDSYNDSQSDVWMIRIREQNSFFKKNYMYLFFVDNKVQRSTQTIFKQKSLQI
jgi:chromosome partitioning protein